VADRSLCLLPTDVTATDWSAEVGDVRLCKTTERLKRQQTVTQLELDALWNAKPVDAILIDLLTARL